ncbi:DUF6527 family protein [Undibacterium sp. TJN19]|uniref:DUF6527 family protein n=1 Tax=Undibacterium sp. TJN19 TaxID=3413055 RepID=UPI003BF17FAD
MIALSKVLGRGLGNKVWFECPGCMMVHALNVTDDAKPRWYWNGNVDKPTFSPSVLVRYTWGNPPQDKVCHSYVTDGRIQFLTDCTHELAGQTVDLPHLDEEWLS